MKRIKVALNQRGLVIIILVWACLTILPVSCTPHQNADNTPIVLTETVHSGEPFSSFTPSRTASITNTRVPSRTPTHTPTLTPVISATPSFTITTFPNFPADTTFEAGMTMVSPMDGMVLVYIPGGKFEMGSENGDEDERPVHTVSLKPYWIDRTEVTNAMYALCVADEACTKPFTLASATRTRYYNSPFYANYPVVNLNSYQAEQYCAWAGRRLPTEAEWEMAARGTDGRTYPWGEGIDCTRANYWGKEGGCVGDTAAVGSYPLGASPFGVLDMAGNVWENVAEMYDPYAYQHPDIQSTVDPLLGDYRVQRGGSWGYLEWNLRASNRLMGNADASYHDFGFRCALSAGQ